MLIRSALILLATVLAIPAAAADFAIDTTHSSVDFKVGHMMVSKVRGSFDDFEGTIHLDPDDMTGSSVEVVIDVASIDTADEKRDEHLRSPDFFDAANHPKMTFSSTSVKKSGSGWVAVGDLTIRGTTRQVELPFEINGPITDPWGNQRIGVEIEPISVDRRDFGLTWSKVLETGGLLVGNEVEIELAVEAVGVTGESGS